jgi:hypothetical protein
VSEVVIRSAVIEDIGQLSDMYCEMYDILFTYGMLATKQKIGNNSFLYLCDLSKIVDKKYVMII